MTLTPLARTPSRFLAALAAVLALALPAQAGPAAYVERTFTAGLGYGFLVPGGPAFGGFVGVELPLSVPLPVDFSVGFEAAYRGELSGRLSFKALLLPSLFGNPPVALAFGADVAAIAAPGAPLGVRVGLGPIVSLDFSPAVLSFSAFPAYGAGGFGLDLTVGGRYYFDPFAVELGFDYSTAGRAGVLLGVRYLF